MLIFKGIILVLTALVADATLSEEQIVNELNDKGYIKFRSSQCRCTSSVKRKILEECPEGTTHVHCETNSRVPGAGEEAGDEGEELVCMIRAECASGLHEDESRDETPQSYTNGENNSIQGNRGFRLPSTNHDASSEEGDKTEERDESLERSDDESTDHKTKNAQDEDGIGGNSSDDDDNDHIKSIETRHDEQFDNDKSEDSKETSKSDNDETESSQRNEHDNVLEYDEDDYKTSIENISIELQEFVPKASSDDDANRMAPGTGSEESLQKLGSVRKKTSELEHEKHCSVKHYCRNKDIDRVCVHGGGKCKVTSSPLETGKTACTISIFDCLQFDDQEIHQMTENNLVELASRTEGVMVSVPSLNKCQQLCKHKGGLRPICDEKEDTSPNCIYKYSRYSDTTRLCHIHVNCEGSSKSNQGQEHVLTKGINVINGAEGAFSHKN